MVSAGEPERNDENADIEMIEKAVDVSPDGELGEDRCDWVRKSPTMERVRRPEGKGRCDQMNYRGRRGVLVRRKVPRRRGGRP